MSYKKNWRKLSLLLQLTGLPWLNMLLLLLLLLLLHCWTGELNQALRNGFECWF